MQTVRNYFLNRFPRLPDRPAERLLLPVNDGSGDVLVAALHRPGAESRRPLVVLIHGLGGCETSCYLVTATAYFLKRGHPVLRLNLRGAGPSRPRCRLQYHAGSTADLHAALGGLDPALTRHGVVAVGFSLGGNLLLKYLGEHGPGAPIAAAASVSAPIDLAAASRCLLRWRNAFYQRYLLGGIKRNCTTPAAEVSARERAAVLAARSLYEFDHAFTAARNGYRDADHFYEANAAKRFLDAVRVPTLLVHARDDPFVPAAPYDRVDWRRLPHLTPLLPAGGGHLGFHDPSRVWLLRRIGAFFDGRPVGGVGDVASGR